MKRFILILLLLIVFVFSLNPVYAKTNYNLEMGRILINVIDNMSDFKYAIDSLLADEMTPKMFIYELRNTKSNAFKNLKDSIELYDIAPDKDVHTRFINMVSSWNISVDILKEGVKNGDNNALTTSLSLIEYMNKEALSLKDAFN